MVLADLDVNVINVEWAKGLRVPKIPFEGEDGWCEEMISSDLIEDDWIDWDENHKPMKNPNAEWLYFLWSMDFTDHQYAAKRKIFDPSSSNFLTLSFNHLF